MPADFGAPVAQNVDVSPQKGLETIKSLMGLKYQQQAIEGQAYQNQSLQADAQKDQQTMRERLALQKMMASGVDDQGNNIRDANGEPDPSRVLPALGRMAPLTGQGIAQSIIKTLDDKAGLRTSLTTLDAQQRNMLSGIAAAQANDPNSTSKTFGDAVDNLVAQHPEMGPAANFAKSIASHADKIPDPGQKKTLWQKLQSAMQAPQPIGTSPSPTSVDTGAAIQPGAVSPQTGAFTPAGAAIPKQLPPSAIMLTDGSGKQWQYNPQTRGLSLVGAGGAGNAAPPGAGPVAPGTPPAPGGAGMSGRDAVRRAHTTVEEREALVDQARGRPPVANQSSFTQPGYPGWKGDIEANQGEIRGIRAAGDAVPQSHSINQQILRLSQNTSTGPLTAWARENIPGLGGIAGDNFQELSKYLEKNAINNMSAMGGPPSDARLSAAAAANGSTHFNPGALQAVTKFNDATASALEKFRQGADAAVGLEKPDYTKLAKFKSDWAKNFDVDAFRLENAVRDGDKAEQNAIVKGMTPAQRKTLQIKRRNMNALATTGALP